MKKFIIASTIAFTLISATAFAGKDDNPAAKTFQKEFKGAEDVKWSEGTDIISATFILSSSRVVAYFSNSGELLGTVRNVLFNQLPLTAIKEINNRFGSTPVFDITEYTTGDDTVYYMYVDTPTKHLKLRVSTAGEISVEKKTKK